MSAVQLKLEFERILASGRAILAPIIADVSEDLLETGEEESRTELDSHANMPVVGRGAYVISRSGLIVDVSPFSPEYKRIEVELVDAAVLYE